MAEHAPHAPVETQETAPHTHSVHAVPVGHGNSPAAWTCVFVMMIGAAISSVAFALAATVLFWVGIAVMVIGLIIGWAMRKAGYGVDGAKLESNGNGH